MYNNSIFRALLMVFEVLGILSVMYLNMRSDMYSLCINNNGMSHYINIRYLWLFVVLVMVRHIYLYFYKESINAISILIKILLGIFSAGSILLSFKVYYLEKFNVDNVQLKFNLYINRIWKPEELHQYLLNILLKKEYVFDKLKELKVPLPLSEEVVSDLLKNCATLNQVDISLNDFINILDNNKKEFSNYLCSNQVSDLKSNITGQIETVHTYLYDNNVYWCLAGLTVAVVLTVVGYYYLSDNVTNMSEKMDSFDSKVENLSEEVYQLSDKIELLNLRSGIHNSDSTSLEGVGADVEDVCKRTNILERITSNLENKVKTLENENAGVKYSVEDTDSNVALISLSVKKLHNNNTLLLTKIDSNTQNIADIKHNMLSNESEVIKDSISSIKSLESRINSLEEGLKGTVDQAVIKTMSELSERILNKSKDIDKELFLGILNEIFSEMVGTPFPSKDN